MASILRRYPDERQVVVVSAFGAATRDLDFAARLAVKGMADDATERCRHVVDDHRTLVRDLIPSATVREALDVLLQACETDIVDLLTGIAITRQLSARTLDALLAYGEFMALHIARHVLTAENLDATSVDVRNVLVTTNDFGRAVPLVDATRVRVDHALRPLLEEHAIVVTQGFVGRSADGETTTMGRESSNLTASLLGALLGASEVTIWTDVDGIRSADPSLCDGTYPRPRLSYREARLAATHGVKLLYPTMIEPAERTATPIRIAAAAHPDAPGTVIDDDDRGHGPIVVLRDHDDDDTLVDLTVLAPPPAAWVRAVATLVEDLHLDQGFGCSMEVGAGAATLTLPAPVGRRALQLLHERLVHA